jgi:hypothetical protein
MLIFLLYDLILTIALFIPPMNPLSIAGQGTLSSDCFHVSDVSLIPDLTMQLMSAEQITDHNYHVTF